jgi:hypothetical protein
MRDRDTKASFTQAVSDALAAWRVMMVTVL